MGGSMGRSPAGLLGLLALSLALSSACARTVVTSPPRPAVAGAEETGLASWYGYPYHGRPTASGEVYDMRDMTAAHRTLPFGTRLAVTNLDNARMALVRVNDRGPFVDGRVLDLSYAAALALEAVGPGVVPVRIRVVGPAAEPPAAPRAGGPAAYAVQVGAFASRAQAERLRDALATDGEEVRILEASVAGQALYRVRLGPFADRLAAQSAADRCASRGYPGLIVPER
jgi:rare lipoprotein A